ncbi:MAG: alpha/beta fold hydrolase [Desulfovibrio sp.]|nr:alpha/beta fold hydrolase [Desulfovibrio sp.]
MTSFLCPLFFLFFLVALCGNLLFWYETLNAEACAIPRPQAGLAECLKRFAESFCGYVLCVGLALCGIPAGRKFATPTPGGNPALSPVVLVHGLYNNSAVWLFVRRILRRRGFSVTAFSYGSFSSPLDKVVRNLDSHVGNVEKAHPGKKIIFIGHSLGGILIRTWLLAPSSQMRAAAVLTLGTPHGGSKLATLAFGSMSKNITPKAALIERLRNAPPPDVPCVSLVSPADEAVLPASALVPPLPPEGNWKLVVTPPVPHFNMLFSRRVADLLLEELAALTGHAL